MYSAGVSRLAKGRSSYRSLHFAEKVETHSAFKTIRAYKRELKILRNNSNCACSSAVRFARAARTTDMEIGLKTGMSTFFILTTRNQIYGVSTTSTPLPSQNRGRSCEKYKVKTCPVVMERCSEKQKQQNLFKSWSRFTDNAPIIYRINY